MEADIKYLYCSNNQTISYDKNDCYINGIKKEIDGVGSSQIKAVKFAGEVCSQDLGRLLGHFTNVAVLASSGTSMDNGSHSGKTRDGLWDLCVSIINDVKFILDDKRNYTEKLKTIENNKDIEAYLSYLNLYEMINGPILDAKKCSLKKALMDKIAEACKLELDKDNNHHGEFIRKMTARKPSEPRFQLFTTNYDTLFEQAAVKRGGYTIIDGFTFAYPRVFSGANFDLDIVNRKRTRVKQEESFAPNVFQLFKIHGSIDWEEKDGKIFQKEITQVPCIVYPASNKYESSYEQPYFEMMAHFQQTLRKESTLLIVVGFGFKDKHIQNTIREAVEQNPNFHLFIVAYNGDNGGIEPDLVDGYINSNGSPKESNVSVFYSKFKDFVKIIPLNISYDNDDNDDESIRSE